MSSNQIQGGAIHQIPMNPTSHVAVAHMQNLMMKHNNFMQIGAPGGNGGVISSDMMVMMNNNS